MSNQQNDIIRENEYERKQEPEAPKEELEKTFEEKVIEIYEQVAIMTISPNQARNEFIKIHNDEMNELRRWMIAWTEDIKRNLIHQTGRQNEPSK